MNLFKTPVRPIATLLRLKKGPSQPEAEIRGPWSHPRHSREITEQYEAKMKAQGAFRVYLGTITTLRFQQRSLTALWHFSLVSGKAMDLVRTIAKAL